MTANQRYLLTEMGLGHVNHNFQRRLAKPFFPIQSIHATFPRTESAFFKDWVGFLDPLGQFTFFFQHSIGWKPLPVFLYWGVSRVRRENQGAAKYERTFDEISSGYLHIENPMILMCKKQLKIRRFLNEKCNLVRLWCDCALQGRWYSNISVSSADLVRIQITETLLLNMTWVKRSNVQFR